MGIRCESWTVPLLYGRNALSRMSLGNWEGESVVMNSESEYQLVLCFSGYEPWLRNCEKCSVCLCIFE